MEVRETATISERAATTAKTTGKMLVQFISPGWGTSGYYGPKVLEEAATNRVIPAGTHMYADHPTADDRKTRPERSIRDLMAVTTSDAQLSDSGALVGEVRVLAPYQSLIEDLKDHIGVSILGDATDIYEGEADGRRGRIIAGLDKVHSVDFVTRAGRGGQVLSLLESALEERDFSGEQRKKMADKGTAMSDGSFPIANTEDLHNAIQALGRAKDPEAAKRHIIARARKLGAVGSLPKDWGVKESLSFAEVWTQDGMIPPLEDLLLETLHLPDDMDPELREVVTSGQGAAGTARLHRYWMSHITWGKPGDFDECVRHLSKYVRDPKGYCAKMHKAATGATPGHAAGESMSDERVITLLESGLGVDQDGHSYRFTEGSWQPVVARERVLTVLESYPELAVDEEGHTYRYKHGWIPIGHTDEDKAIAKLSLSQRQAYANHRSAGMSHEEALGVLVKGHENDLKLANKMGYKRGTSVHNNHSDMLKMAKQAQKTSTKKADVGKSSDSPANSLDDHIAKLEARKSELMKLPSARLSRSGASDQIRDLNRQIASLRQRKSSK